MRKPWWRPVLQVFCIPIIHVLKPSVSSVAHKIVLLAAWKNRWATAGWPLGGWLLGGWPLGGWLLGGWILGGWLGKLVEKQSQWLEIALVLLWKFSSKSDKN